MDWCCDLYIVPWDTSIDIRYNPTQNHQNLLYIYTQSSIYLILTYEIFFDFSPNYDQIITAYIYYRYTSVSH
jgi:hypothetical protein